MERVKQEVEVIVEIVERPVNSLDDIVSQLGYIEDLQKDQMRVEDIFVQVRKLQQSFDHLEQLKCKLRESDLKVYYKLLFWPYNFRRWISKHRETLSATKD